MFIRSIQVRSSAGIVHEYVRVVTSVRENGRVKPIIAYYRIITGYLGRCLLRCCHYTFLENDLSDPGKQGTLLATLPDTC